jgi:malonyl CoA-acyl carrier protein transacylase
MSATLTAPRLHAPTTHRSGWDSHVFILRADDRDHLRARATNLASFLEREPGTNPTDLAASLATHLQPAGVGLAVIATSIPDLLAKLRRACERLSDPNCKQIRDTAGTYFTSQPLFPEGKLALLFPGEGAQYPDMLADLCGVFPEVEETFSWCDRLAAELGRPEGSLRNILHLPPDATPEDRIAAEAQLRRLGPSIFGVLIADLAITRVLQNLELPVSAVAGHSAGELAALLAAGSLRSDVILGPKLAEIMDLMQTQEDETGGPNVSLLAVGAGRAVVVEIAEKVAGSSVLIAMDNCPHQCVAVGPTTLVAKVESDLQERGLVCERLPFRRPYHTPMFEPWMGPYRELFAGIPFEQPHTPVYCCSTGEEFPSNADAIRDLAVNHWVSPVEFTKMVDAMYADGVRMFVEAGPRGNLSAFTEDILRGRQFAAIPANVPRKSGPTQINHLIGQLAVHQVPVNLNHLFQGLETEFVAWERSHSNTNGSTQNFPDSKLKETNGELSTPEQLTSPWKEESPGIEVMNGYLRVMEQFLDVQRSVMEAFLTGEADPSTIFHLEDFTFPDSGAIQSATPPTTTTQPQFALIGQVEQFVPDHEILVRRVLDEREDLYADHHTLAGRGVSRVNPGQNGLPVLPMTFSIEGMAEAALLLVPGKVVIAVRNIRLFRWLPFDPDPTTLEIRASVASADPATGVVEVKADVRDLGNSFIQDGANKVAAEAVIVLADQYPEPPEPLAFQLTNEQHCHITVEDLRRNMFHGPLFQMIRSLERQGKEGIEGTLEVQPRNGWFQSNSEPQIVLDPVLIDAAMHILGAWHLEQPDWTGRILLPFEVQRIEFFGPTPTVGSQLIIRGHNEQESARHFRHGLEMLDADSRLWLRMTGAGYWRFYLPFGHVNFFGPKDEYFLSRDWPEAVLTRSGGVPRRCHYLDPPADLKQPVLRAAGARVTMTPRELVEFREWAGNDDGLNDWFFGRLVAKDAVRAAWMEKHGEAIFPADIETELVDERIVCRPRGSAGSEPFPPVSVAIANGRIAAFSAFACHVGIALLPISKDEPDAKVRARAACQAVTDALKIPADGLMATLVDEATGEHCVMLPPDVSKLYPTLTGQAIRVQTARQQDFIVATTMCEVGNS